MSSTDSDHDLLVRIDERVLRLDNLLKNHLRQHQAVVLAAIVAFFTGCTALVLTMLTAAGKI